MLKEFRYAGRGLARSPAFTAIAVTTLALGIGANTAVFTLVDGVLLRPLPYAAPDRLVSVAHEGRGGEDELPISPGLYLVYREHARSLASLGLFQGTVANFVGDDGSAERVDGQAVTPSLFEVLRVRPALGRTLVAADAEPGADPVVVLSHALWSSMFGRDPAAVGRTVIMDGVSRQVVGVMPPGFTPNPDTRLWIPMSIDPTTAPLGSFSPSAVGRLADGATVETARAELVSLIRRLEDLRPDAGPVLGFLREVRLTAVVEPLKEAMVGDVGRTLWTLLGMVGFVLLIACANVANLLLVRAEGRQRELALRRAIGAGRWDVIRPFLAESLGLALAGGALGVAMAALAVRTTLALAPAGIPRMNEVGVDFRVLAFTGAVSLLAALIFGLLPSFRYGRSDLSGHLKDGAGRGGTTGRERHRTRNTLVVTQVALALVLLVGSGLMIRSLMALLAVHPGFEPEGVLTVRLGVPPGEIADPAAVADFYRQVQDRLRAQPGVVAVGAVAGGPLTGQLGFFAQAIEDHPTPPDGLPPLAFASFADPGYFEAMEIPLLEGRTLHADDGATGFRGAVVSRAFADRWWPGGSALGRRIRPGGGPDGAWWEIVGVVADVRNRSLQEDPEEIIYYPTLVGEPDQPGAIRSRDLVVRVDGDAAAFLPVLRREVRDLNARIPLANPRTMRDIVEQSMSRTSFTMVVLSSASFVALLLGMVGIYGVVSYVVSQRTREIGVRMALGAPRATVRSMVVRQGMTLAVVGVAIGLIGAVAGSRLLQTLLYGVSATDPVTYTAVAAVLAAVALAASWIPARRAAAVDPAIALRNE
ncbi:MAG TPA: ABC transporter permease [Longimicrobiales bacterium]|nr:ABC transporter permease [Longimicrobiales bacterium]